MKTIHTCVAGRQHAAAGKACEDVIVSRTCESVTVTVLCDGAGSKEFGLQSATLIANEAACYLTENFHHFDAERFVDHVNFSLEKEGYIGENAGATLLFVATDDKRYLIGHVGDGVIMQQTAEGFLVASKPENGHLANTTYLLPASFENSHLRVQRGNIKRPTSFILSSDGAAEFLYDPQTGKGYRVCDYFAQWARNEDPIECQEAITMNLQQEFSKYTSDDMSIAVMVTE